MQGLHCFIAMRMLFQTINCLIRQFSCVFFGEVRILLKKNIHKIVNVKMRDSLRMQQLDNHKGFTLIELLIVVAIIGILTGIALFSSRGMLENYKLKGAARQIYSDMQLARLRAIKEGVNCALEYAGNTYAIKFPGIDGSFGTSDDTLIKSVDLAADYRGVSISSGPSRNIFHPKGTAAPLIGGTVALTNGIKTRQVSVNPSTGNIRIQ
jgi:type IV fimbrial biogenesis protein FimT